MKYCTCTTRLLFYFKGQAVPAALFQLNMLVFLFSYSRINNENHWPYLILYCLDCKTFPGDRLTSPIPLPKYAFFAAIAADP